MPLKSIITIYVVSETDGSLIDESKAIEAYREFIGLEPDEEVTPFELASEYAARGEFKEFLSQRLKAFLSVNEEEILAEEEQD